MLLHFRSFFLFLSLVLVRCLQFPGQKMLQIHRGTLQLQDKVLTYSLNTNLRCWSFFCVYNSTGFWSPADIIPSQSPDLEKVKPTDVLAPFSVTLRKPGQIYRPVSYTDNPFPRVKTIKAAGSIKTKDRPFNRTSNKPQT